MDRTLAAWLGILTIALAAPAALAFDFSIETVNGTGDTYTATAMDGEGVPYIAFTRSDGFYIAERTSEGTWLSVPVIPGAGPLQGPGSVALMKYPQGTIGFRPTFVSTAPGATMIGFWYKGGIPDTWYEVIAPLTVWSPGYPQTVTSLAAATTPAGEMTAAYTTTDGLLWFARRNGGSWTKTTVATGAEPVVSLALESSGLARIAYRDAASSRIVYAQEVVGNPSWVLQYVSPDDGETPSLVLNSSNQPRIAYRSAQGLMFAEGTGPGGVALSWNVEIAQSGSWAGTSPSLDLTGGLELPWIASCESATGSVWLTQRLGGPGSQWQSTAVASYLGSPVGTSLWIDGKSAPKISYASIGATHHRLDYAEGGIWVAKIQNQGLQNQTYVAKWGGKGPIAVDLSTDGGNSYQTVADDVMQSPASFTLPAVQTASARVRIRRASDESSAISPNTFRIVRPTTPPNPIAPQRWSSTGSTNERRGFSSASAGDFNGDGYPDEILGAPLDATFGSFTGRAYVYFGGPAGDGVADRTLQGTAAGEAFGYSVAGTGDLNGDGYDDIAVGAPAFGITAGKVYVFYGGPANGDATPDRILNGVQIGESFGNAVCRAGDWNGDGYADLAAGAPFYDVSGQMAGDQGLVRIYFGGPGFDSVSDFGIVGSQAFEQFGTSVAGGGDENGDGFADLVAGAPYFDSVAGQDAGRAAVYFGGRGFDNLADSRFEGEEAFGRFGATVAFAGDMNGDGLGDVAVGAPVAQSGKGKVFVYTNPGPPEISPGPPDLNPGPPTTSPGPPGISPGPPNIVGEAVDDQLGYSIAGVGDLNGDGFADLVIGAPLNDEGADQAGRAYVIFGTTQMDMRPGIVLTGQVSGDRFGSSVAAHAASRCCNFGYLLVGGDQAAAGATPGMAALYDFSLFKVVSPKGGETWPVGALRDVRWLGSEKADLELSVDGGVSWTTLAENCGGQAVNQVSLRVPHTPGKFSLVRVNPGPPDTGGSPGPPDVGINPGPPNGVAVSDSFFTIQTSVSLLALLAAPAPEGRGAVLTWSTDPGPADLAGYRIERDGGSGFQTVAPLLHETTYTDTSPGAAARYRLYAVNGLGEEVLVGETSLAPRAPLAAWPLPYRGGKLSINFATFGGLGGGMGAAQVDLFDVSGRLVKRISRGNYTAGRQAVTWDGNDEQGRPVSSGIYFLRASSAGDERKMKVTVLR